MIFLRMPVSLASRLGVNTELLEEAKALLPRDNRLPGESSATAREKRNLRPVSAGMPAQLGRDVPNPGIKKKLLLKENPDWNSLTADDLLDPTTVSDYWPKVAKGLVCRIIASTSAPRLPHAKKSSRYSLLHPSRSCSKSRRNEVMSTPLLQ